MGGTFLAAVGQTEVVDAAEAAACVIRDCERKLQGRKPAAALLFADINLEHATILDSILEAWPGIHLVGCTTDGEFSSELGYTQDSLLLVALACNSVSFASGYAEAGPDLAGACRPALEAALAGSQAAPSLGLVFTDGLTFTGEDALLGLSEALGHRVPLLGGTAADGWRFTGTLQFHGRRILTGGAVFLLFCGTFPHAFAIHTGWKPIGRAGIVTRSERNVVMEIDGKPPIAFYQEQMGDTASPSVETPIAVYDPKGSFRYLRTSYGAPDPETGAITYFAGIPVGSQVRVTLVNRDAIVQGAAISLRQAQANFPAGHPIALALCFSCAARRVILGSRTVDEYRAAREAFGEAVPIAGFYAFGEFAPPSAGANQFNNESFVTLLLG